MEHLPNIENTAEKAFERAYQSMLTNGVENFAELDSNRSKVDFLKWLVEKKGFLLHGSNNQHIAKLEPRLANCASKEFGNLTAVYAVEDSVLPTFYAIKDKEKFRGTAQSGYSSRTNSDGTTTKEYTFAVSKQLLDTAHGLTEQYTLYQEILLYKDIMMRENLLMSGLVPPPLHRLEKLNYLLTTFHS